MEKKGHFGECPLQNPNYLFILFKSSSINAVQISLITQFYILSEVFLVPYSQGLEAFVACYP